MIERILQNWPYKLLSLITALSLWAFVNSEQNPIVSVSRSVHLEFRDLDKTSYTITSGTNDVDVNFQGPKSEVDSVMRAANLKAWVDLQGRGAGTHSVAVNVSPGSTKDVTVRPVQPSITLTVESVASRVLPVEVNFVGSPPVGYSYDDPKVIPASATVSGRSSIVDNIRRLTVTVDPSAGSGLDIDRYYTVKALDGSGNEVKGIDVSPERIRVRLDLVAVPARKSVFVSPTIVGQPQYPYKVTKVSVIPETVIIVGKPAMLLDISTIGTEDVTIDGAVQNISRDVELRLPPDVDISGSKKVRVNVRIELRQDQT